MYHYIKADQQCFNILHQLRIILAQSHGSGKFTIEVGEQCSAKKTSPNGWEEGMVSAGGGCAYLDNPFSNVKPWPQRKAPLLNRKF